VDVGGGVGVGEAAIGVGEARSVPVGAGGETGVGVAIWQAEVTRRRSPRKIFFMREGIRIVRGVHAKVVILAM
jgi:hypothetical protein